MNDVDGQIKRAQTTAYEDMFMNALRGNKPNMATAAISKLAAISPQQASILMAGFPNAKDIWNYGNQQTQFNQTLEAKRQAQETGFQNDLKKMEVANGYDLNKMKFANSLDINKMFVQADIKNQQEAIAAARRAQQFPQEVAARYNAAKQYGMSDSDASAYALGVGGKGSAGSGAGKNPEDKRYKQLTDYLDRFEKLHKDDMNKDWMNDPEYVSRKKELDSYTDKEYDTNDYYSLNAMATKMADDGYTADEIRNTLNYLNPELGPSVYNGISWSQFETRPERYNPNDYEQMVSWATGMKDDGYSVEQIAEALRSRTQLADKIISDLFSK